MKQIILIIIYFKINFKNQLDEQTVRDEIILQDSAQSRSKEQKVKCGLANSTEVSHHRLWHYSDLITN